MKYSNVFQAAGADKKSKKQLDHLKKLYSDRAAKGRSRINRHIFPKDFWKNLSKLVKLIK